LPVRALPNVSSGVAGLYDRPPDILPPSEEGKQEPRSAPVSIKQRYCGSANEVRNRDEYHLSRSPAFEISDFIGVGAKTKTTPGHAYCGFGEVNTAGITT